MYPYYFRYFKRMVQIFSSQPFYSKYIHQPSSNQSPHLLCHNKKLWPFFQHALGAIDGSHIHFSPPVFCQAAYRNRKGFLSQNCLFACSFNLMFTYALTGWEGSAADARVYHDAVNSDLVIPEGWYYLGDAGFPHCDQGPASCSILWSQIPSCRMGAIYHMVNFICYFIYTLN